MSKPAEKPKDPKKAAEDKAKRAQELNYKIGDTFIAIFLFLVLCFFIKLFM